MEILLSLSLKRRKAQGHNFSHCANAGASVGIRGGIYFPQAPVGILLPSPILFVVVVAFTFITPGLNVLAGCLLPFRSNHRFTKDCDQNVPTMDRSIDLPL